MDLGGGFLFACTVKSFFLVQQQSGFLSYALRHLGRLSLNRYGWQCRHLRQLWVPEDDSSILQQTCHLMFLAIDGEIASGQSTMI